MDINKSLYMTDFLKVTQDLGTVELFQVKNTLFTNLYDEMTPKSHSNEVIEVVKNIKEDIKQKTVMILENSPEMSTSPILPELFSDLPEEETKQEVKTIQLSKDIPVDKQVNNELKQIIIDPNYNAEK